MKAQRAVQIALAIILAAAALWLGRDETWVVRLILLAPAARLAFIRPDGAFAASARTFLLAAAVASLVAVALHYTMAQMLGGFLQPGEVLWSAFFYTGCLNVLEGLDAMLQRLLRRVRSQGYRSLLRLAAVLIVLPPLAVAVIQTVRVKIGYELPREAQALHPQVFTTTTADGVRLHGYYFDRGSATTVVVAHGLGAHAENFMPYLTTVVENHAVNGLIFDFRAHGYSGGHVSSFGYHEVHDVLAAIDWLEAHHPERAERIILYGFSMGSAAAIYAAPRIDNLAGLIIDSGLARLTDVAWALAQQTPPGVRQLVYGGGLPVACLIAEAPLWAIEPVEVMDDIHVPMRIVHGGADMLIPVEQGRALLDKAGGHGRIISGGHHTNLPMHDAEYFNYIGRFIEAIAGQESGDRNQETGILTPAP